MSAAATVLAPFAAALARTWRLEVAGADRLAQLAGAGRPVLFAVWHANLLAPLWDRRRRGITLLVSGHRDGARLAAAARRWGYRVVTGSTTRGGVGGLKGVVRALARGRDCALTPDGPRGPARRAQQGVLAAAQLTGAPIVPVSVAASAAWRAGSWDRFLVPRPGARVRVSYGAPLPVPRDGGTPALAVARQRLEAALDVLEQDASPC